MHMPRRRRLCTRWLRSHRSRRGKPRSRRIVGSKSKAHLTLALSRRLKASPGAHPNILNYVIYIYVPNICALGLGIGWNRDAWFLVFPGPHTSMNRSLALLCLIGLDRSRVIILSLARYRMSLYYSMCFIIFKMEGKGWETGWGKV